MVENMFSNRKNAVDHLKTAFLEDGGHGVQIDANQSGKNRVVSVVQHTSSVILEKKKDELRQ